MNKANFEDLSKENGLCADSIIGWYARYHAVQLMGDDKLKLIAHEALDSLKANISIDFAHRQNTLGRLHVLTKRISKKY